MTIKETLTEQMQFKNLSNKDGKAGVGYAFTSKYNGGRNLNDSEIEELLETEVTNMVNYPGNGDRQPCTVFNYKYKLYYAAKDRPTIYVESSSI